MTDTGKRGSGRTTRALQEVLKAVLEGPEPKLAVYVTQHPREDDYCFRIIARLAKDQTKQYSTASRMVTFKSGGRIRFVSYNDNNLLGDPGCCRLVGYRPDTPIVWDHYAVDLWAEREIARNSPPDGRSVEARRLREPKK